MTRTELKPIPTRSFKAMIRSVLLIVVCVAAGGLCGCGRITVDLSAGSRSVYAPLDHFPPQLEFQYYPSPERSRFEIRATAAWVVWFIPVNHPDWQDLTDEVIGEADGIGNLVVHTRKRPGDVIVTVLTLGFFRTTQVVVSGDRIRLIIPEKPRPTPG